MIRRDVPLAPLTTLGVGGLARAFAEVPDRSALVRALAQADEEGWPVLILGGGSNLLVSDAGHPGLAIRYVNQDIKEESVSSCTHMEVGAGASWDHFVALAVQRGLAGVECLSGIPGCVGAAPMQNVGAYGQEVRDTIVSVRAWDRRDDREVVLAAEECGFGYRDSHFKGLWAGRYVVLSVVFALQPGGRPTLRSGELTRRLGPEPDLSAVREAVLSLRRTKAMVLDPAEPDSRSAGSFFTNPRLDPAVAQRVMDEAARLRPGSVLPSWPTDDGRVKLPAAWLIEASGSTKGEVCGGAAISRRHSLALVNRGGASAADVVRLAGRVRRRVRDAFGITLVPEPRFVGFDQTVDEMLG